MCKIRTIEYRPGKIRANYPSSYDDFYSCGNCGKSLGVNGILANYCPNCGRKIFWDSPRCLTRKASWYSDPEREIKLRHYITQEERLRTLGNMELAHFLEKVAKGKILQTNWYSWLISGVEGN